MFLRVCFLLGALAFLAACQGESSSKVDGSNAPKTLEITSAAFAEGETIPQAHSCDGVNRSPPLAWSGIPEQAKTLALICDDPDAPSGTFVHWVLYNMPATETALAEGVPTQEKLTNGAIQGKNGAGKIGYTGPCPPGGTHRYYFKLYALDAQLELAAGATKAELFDAMEGHVLAQGALMGRYER